MLSNVASQMQIMSYMISNQLHLKAYSVLMININYKRLKVPVCSACSLEAR